MNRKAANRHQDAASNARQRTVGLRYHLWGLVAATLLPMLAMGLLATWLTGKQIRQTSLERLQSTASTLARSVEQGLEIQLEQLRQRGLIEERYRQVSLPDLPGQRSAMVLPSPGWPSARPSRSAAAAHWISNVYLQPATGQPSVAIATRLPGKQRLLVHVQPSSDLIHLLPPSGGNPTSIIALVDSQGFLAARSVDPERWVGKRVPDWHILNAMRSSTGHIQVQTQEGGEIVFAFQRLQTAPGWTLVVGESLQHFQSSWVNPLKGILAGGLFALLLALVASHLLARRILRPVTRLAQRSQMIANGSDCPTMPPVSAVTEFEQLRLSLSEAENVLQQRADDARRLAEQLERNQRRYRMVAEAGALVFWEADDTGAMLTTAGWSELTDLPEEESLGRGWERSVHPDDLPRITEHWTGCVVHGADLDIEFRIRNSQGQWHWVRARGAQVGDLHDPQWAGVLEDVNARRQAQDNLAWLAHHDSLTGLANRTHFRQTLENALSAATADRQVALFCLDLDHFKQVNDTHGHPVGDELLCQVARRLCQQLRSQDLVARLGGDEFAVVMTGQDLPPVCAQLASRIIQSVSAPYQIDNQELHIGVSIGICTTTHDSMDSETLHHLADQALYAAKQQGRCRFVIASGHPH